MTKSGDIPSGNTRRLAKELDAFENMYQFHSAHEDTVVFPAWKSELSDQAYKEMQQQFAETERKILGNNGEEEALHTIVRVEKELGIFELPKHTMPIVKPR